MTQALAAMVLNDNYVYNAPDQRVFMATFKARMLLLSDNNRHQRRLQTADVDMLSIDSHQLLNQLLIDAI